MHWAVIFQCNCHRLPTAWGPEIRYWYEHTMYVYYMYVHVQCVHIGDSVCGIYLYIEH